MSWKTINRILGLAAIDSVFWQALQNDPLVALQAHGFELTLEEQEAFCTLKTSDLAEFSQHLLDTLALDSQHSKSRKE